jgi:hypothetical protein
MHKPKMWAALLVALPLGVMLPACGRDGKDRAALEKDELDRELELALKKDTAPATFKDAPVETQPAPAPSSAPATKPAAPASKPAPKPAAPAPAKPAESRPRTAAMTVSTGTTFAVHLNETLSTDKSQVGDPFTATLSDPVVGSDGTVLFPAGATVHGRVTATEKSDHVGETAVIKLAFESISFDGKSYPMQASVVEANPERKTRTTAKQSAAKVAAGAAAGAVIGQVLGKNTKSTVIGGAVGAAAGTAIALGTADVDAVLSSGSRMVIRLDGPVEVQRTVY